MSSLRSVSENTRGGGSFLSPFTESAFHSPTNVINVFTFPNTYVNTYVPTLKADRSRKNSNSKRCRVNVKDKSYTEKNVCVSQGHSVPNVKSTRNCNKRKKTILMTREKRKTCQSSLSRPTIADLHVPKYINILRNDTCL